MGGGRPATNTRFEAPILGDGTLDGSSLDETSFQAFVDRRQLTFPKLSDPDGELYEHFGIVAQPAFIVIAPDGDTTRSLGAVGEDELNQTLADVTGPQSTPD